jgi:hypothetical protein
MHGLYANKRYWLPFLLGLACLAAVPMVSPLVAWLLISLAFYFLFDALTAWFARLTNSGDLRDYKQ